jgi:tRNA pseudouridine38-40 synthase
MTRWALELEYDGTRFVGWQRQLTGLSVQSVLEDAAARLDGRPVASVAAGRTDAGVHAAAQVAHLDLERALTPDRMVAAMNYHLKPHPVAVLRAAQVPDGWSARFSAIRRAYRYDILNRPARAALLSHRVWHIPGTLDVAAMQAGARHLLGRHDFTSFRAAGCQANSPLRTLDRLDVTRHGELVGIVAEARSFLHHQVRNMVGSLRLVGEGRWTPTDMARVLAAADRRLAGPTAPAAGLFLTAIGYARDPFADASEPRVGPFTHEAGPGAGQPV